MIPRKLLEYVNDFEVAYNNERLGGRTRRRHWAAEEPRTEIVNFFPKLQKLTFDMYNKTQNYSTFGEVSSAQAQFIENITIKFETRLEWQLDRFWECSNLKYYSLVVDRVPSEVDLSHWKHLQTLELTT